MEPFREMVSDNSTRTLKINDPPELKTVPPQRNGYIMALFYVVHLKFPFLRTTVMLIFKSSY